MLDAEEDRGRFLKSLWLGRHRRNLTALAGNVEMAYILLCWPPGYDWIADNPIYKSRLARMGVKKELMFACAMDFLFGVRPEVLGGFKEELAVLGDAAPLKIGIQLRMGDHVFEKGHNATAADLAPFR